MREVSVEPEKCDTDFHRRTFLEEEGEGGDRRFQTLGCWAFGLEWGRPVLPSPCFQLSEVAEEEFRLLRIRFRNRLLGLRSD